MKSQITRNEWDKYILDLFFGRAEHEDDRLKKCINRAYRDFNRTLHGFGSHDNNKGITTEIKEYLFHEFVEIKTINIKTQVDFDNWHKSQCLRLKALYSEHNYSSFIGQAQKWINMTFKYIFSYGNKYLNGYDEIYQFCHVPLDNILIDSLKSYNPPDLEEEGDKISWSRITEYDTYIKYQIWFRKQFKDLPLDVEFKLWLGESL